MMTAGVEGAGLAVSVFLAVVSEFWARTRKDSIKQKQERYMVFSMTEVLVKKECRERVTERINELPL